MGVFVGKRVGTGTEESKLVEKALVSWVVVAVGISLIGDLAVSRTRHAVWGREGGGHCWKSVQKGPTS